MRAALRCTSELRCAALLPRARWCAARLRGTPPCFPPPPLSHPSHPPAPLPLPPPPATPLAGISEPIRLDANDTGTRSGLGRRQEEAQYTSADNVYRRTLETELQAEEDEGRARKREVRALTLLFAVAGTAWLVHCSHEDLCSHLFACRTPLRPPALPSHTPSPSSPTPASLPSSPQPALSPPRSQAEAERQQRIRDEVSHELRMFYCATCHKQYHAAHEMEKHLSSYDHHHRKRLGEAKVMMAERGRAERERKERRAAERELARVHAQ